MNLIERRTTLQRKSAITLALATALAAGSATAADTWYVGATGGLTNNGVSSLNLTTDGVDGRATADADNGYTMGAVFGREFDSRWRLEGEFRYRTNEFASVDLPDGSRITDGDFSSGALGVNGYWLFGEVDAAWRPFVGAGLAWMQEIDLDLADDPVNKIVDSLGEALDGEISDIEDGTLPSGNSTAGGDAEFVVGALEGDTDGDAE